MSKRKLPVRTSRPSTILSAAAGFSILLAAAGCSVSIGSNSGPPSAASEIETIRDARLAQNQAIREQDLDAIADVYEADVHATSGAGIHIVGRDAYRRAYEDDFEVLERAIYTRSPDEIEISSVDTGMAERIAWESGTWTGSIVSPRGQAQMRGTYAAMWRKRNGDWRINSEIFVSLTCSGAGCP